MVQSGLANAQTNLDAQAKQLSDVEYWVQNLYGKMEPLNKLIQLIGRKKQAVLGL
jgi:hypothetical protein